MEDTSDLYDLAIIGGGINGCGIARDAIGRGYSVFLCEAGDLGSATSSASTKLVHGGLRYLEHHEFRLVREALMEREVLWGIAPHIIWPLRFVLPHHRGLRPAWLLRLGLFLYDHLGGRKRLPKTRTRRLRHDPAGEPLKPEYTLGFEYSDCWVEDARMVVLNARDAAERGATVATCTRCTGADRESDHWVLHLSDERTGKDRTIRARTLVNAAGPWVGDVLQSVVRANTVSRVRMVKGSHIVVRRLYPGEQCYIFQNSDGRIFFVIPYERDFSLIGTTDMDYDGDPRDAAASTEEIAYLCNGASEYLRRKVTPRDVVWTYSGVRPLYDDGASKAQAATREYVLELDAGDNCPALLSVFGGKITTYRRLAEAALLKLKPVLPAPTGLPPGWTGTAPLPGGDFADFTGELARMQAVYPMVPSTTMHRLVRAYGTCVADLLGPVGEPNPLGRIFGADLSAAEIRY
ncbi:glycerol-3-phosphate dehydrogenase, partial [Acidisphaera sp. L21]|uniref:glycerol-3-phosphate dehydrogenase n=1 Tax=Acidisphaera sp. L21 TaxID=1641851 RepID=UPI00131D2D5C